MHVNLITVLLIPTYLMVIPIVMMFFKKISNEWIYRVHTFLFWGFSITFGIFIYKANCAGADRADSIFAGIMMCFLMLLCNAIQFNLIYKAVELHRCPECHSLGVKTMSKDIWEKKKTTVHTYRYEGKPGIFRKKFQKIIRKTNYSLYCPECGHAYEVVMEDEDNLKSGECRVK